MNCYPNTILGGFTNPKCSEIFCDEGVLQKWLDVEAALALAQGELGIIPESAGIEISRNAKLENLNLPEIYKRIKSTGHELVPVLENLSQICGESGQYVHLGATTQDILDTAVILQLNEIGPDLKRNIFGIIDNLMRLTISHRDTVMAGRTHQQHALPTTLGFKVSVWLDEILRHVERFETIRQKLNVGQFSGGVGTLAGYGPKGMEVQALALKKLGLESAQISWHSARDNFAELLCFFAICGSTFGKISLEIVGLQKTEIGELEESVSNEIIGSSTMPHKRNPIVCETVIAIAKILKFNSGLMIDSMNPMHERDSSCWFVELAKIPESVTLFYSATEHMVDVLKNLKVYPERMQLNLKKSNGLIFSESLMLSLAKEIGRPKAYHVVKDISNQCIQNGTELMFEFLRSPLVEQRFKEKVEASAFSAEKYLGSAPIFVDRVVKMAEEKLKAFNDMHGINRTNTSE
jgi:adenylosuccinate lyase